ncbi:MAG TPA: glycosyltransferase, partial [Sphingomicrobium sp.]|nr:glycosyltransferase [Sphingomicrobium sp.]
MTKPRPRLLLSANSAWNIANFRLGLAKALEGAGFEVIVAAPADGHEGRLREAGIGFLPLWMNRSGMNPIADLQLMGRYSAILRDLRPAAYLGFTIKPNIYGSLAARAHGVRAINNVSGLGTMFLSYGWQSTLARALYRLAFARSQTVFFQNPEDRQQFISTGTVQPTQAKLLPGSGIDLNRFTPTPLPAGSPVFLF